MSAGSIGSLAQGSQYSRSSSQGSSYSERCVDPVDEAFPTPQPKGNHKAHLKEANGKPSETIVFIQSSAEQSSAAHTCNPCSSPRSCRTVMYTVLTCGLYRVCQGSYLAPCLVPKESSPEEEEEEKEDRVSFRAVNSEDSKVEGSSDWLEDVHIGGKKVDFAREYVDIEDESASYVRHAVNPNRPRHTSLQDSIGLDDWEDGEENVDSLITKKLLELYSEYQIEELARCTSDSLFLKKSKAINQLINSLAAEHQMDEQEAECRLVRGIIRISTRRSMKRPHISRRERTLSDSGNDTMKESDSFSSSNNNDYRSNPNIQISELTSSDKCAREMWRRDGGHTSSSPTAYTNSSGFPPLRTSVRT
ncbi:keratinocyte differentiation factor 1 [Gouania willdenowi]|uniref:Keratinocyte differentiation factor 1-like n=1 Tax=Gouania willdenowi TaxID=441366 RepID=A0A8C5EU64_GOUWI|nr:keratinocyte differentiation factor 1-like [Gouania willdenowi]